MKNKKTRKKDAEFWLIFFIFLMLIIFTIINVLWTLFVNVVYSSYSGSLPKEENSLNTNTIISYYDAA